MNLRIAIVGAGALGLYYGALLAKYGRETGTQVAFLARGDYEILTHRGIIVNSTDGDFRLPASELHIFDSRKPEKLAQDFGPVDLILLGLKTTANSAAYAKLIPPLFNSEHTVVLCLQNGIGNETELARHLPADRILGGTAFLCSNRVAPGEIEHTQHAMVHIAPYLENFRAPCDELRPESIRQLFESSGVDCQVRPNYVEMRWRKQIWNVPFNALCTIHNCATDQLLARPEMPERVAAIMREIIELGRRINSSLLEKNKGLSAAERINCGDYRLSGESEAIIAEQLAKTRTMGAYKPSMLLDYRAGRPIESNAIIAACIAERALHAPGYAIPEIERVARELIDVIRTANATKKDHP